MTKTMYAHVNKWIIKWNKISPSLETEVTCDWQNKWFWIFTPHWRDKQYKH
jgi:hypothetical protein